MTRWDRKSFCSDEEYIVYLEGLLDEYERLFQVYEETERCYKKMMEHSEKMFKLYDRMTTLFEEAIKDDDDEQ